MGKGVVVALEQEVAHILKSNGTFITFPRNLGWQVGDVVTMTRLPMVRMKMVLVSCAALVVMMVCACFAVYQVPTTYVELSVNPSVQLTLNWFNRVLRTDALNADGDKLLQQTSYNHLPLDEAYARILNRLENNGYLQNATIHLAIANNSQKKIDAIEQRLRNVSAGKVSGIKVKRYSVKEYLALTHPIQSATPSVEATKAPERTPSPSPPNVEATAPMMLATPQPSPSPSSAVSSEPPQQPLLPRPTQQPVHPRNQHDGVHMHMGENCN